MKMHRVDLGDGGKMTKWGSVLGAEAEFESKQKSSIDSDFDELKCCHDCEHMCGYITEMRTKFAMCREFEIELKPADPVVKCSSYYRRNQLSIHDMKEMATFIDIKRETGFIHSSKYEDE